MLPQAEPPGGRGPGHPAPGVLHPGEDLHPAPPLRAEPVEPAVRGGGDDQRVVVLRAVRVVAALHPEGVAEPAAQVDLRRQVPFHVPGQPDGRLARDAGVPALPARRAQAGVERAPGRVEDANGLPTTRR